jgi:hypothetical protein
VRACPSTYVFSSDADVRFCQDPQRFGLATARFRVHDHELQLGRRREILGFKGDGHHRGAHEVDRRRNDLLGVFVLAQATNADLGAKIALALWFAAALAGTGLLVFGLWMWGRAWPAGLVAGYAF